MKPALINVCGWGYLLMFAAALIYACGGGGVGELASYGGGTGGTGINVGPITGIGSIHVNGIRHDTVNAEIFVESQSQGFGDPAVLAQLAVGMIVRVEGTIEDAQNGTAQRVYFNDDIRGPIAVIRTIGDQPTQFTVLGKEIILQETTATGGVDLNALQVDDWVQVSGFEDADGRIRATFVTAIDSSAKANLKGTIALLNTIDRTFEINGILIDYQAAGLIGMDQLSDNLVVEVTGLLLAPAHIAAEKIEPIESLGDIPAQQIKLEGLISAKPSDTEFRLNGLPVIVDSQTVYSGGTSTDIEIGVLVEVEGELSGGIVHAASVIFRDNVKVEANVAENDGSSSTITLAGLPGITIQYDDVITKVTGAATTTAAIDATHHVTLLGQPTSPPGTLLAIHIIVKRNPSNTVKLQGPLEDYTDPKVTVLGQEVDLSAIPDDNFESPEGVSVTRQDFIDRITSGAPLFISVRGQLPPGEEEVVWQSMTAE
jgi:hypothetical protein